jgi:hypothetical protein
MVHGSAFCLLILLFLQSTALAEERIALLIGNQDYSEGGCAQEPAQRCVFDCPKKGLAHVIAIQAAASVRG